MAEENVSKIADIGNGAGQSKNFYVNKEAMTENQAEEQLGDMYPQPFGDVVNQCLDPFKALADIVLLSRDGFEMDVDEDIARIVETLTQHAQDRLDEWENAVEKHYSRLVLRKASARNYQHTKGKVLGVVEVES